MENCNERKMSEGNPMFNAMWADSFAFHCLLMLLLKFPSQSFRNSGNNSGDDSSDNDEEYVPYIPVKQRKKMEVRKRHPFCSKQKLISVLLK